LQLFSKEDISRLINHKNIKVFDDKSELVKVSSETVWINTNLLLMSSGTFQGLDFKELIRSWK